MFSNAGTSLEIEPPPALLHRAGLGAWPAGESESVLGQLMPVAIARLASWALRTIESLPPTDSHAAGYRDLLPAPDDRHYQWQFPRSNAAERIGAFSWLADHLADKRFHKAAAHYAAAMVDDPIRGIYQDEEVDGRGQVWYWRDIGAYVTNYTIRVPSAMLEFARRTGQKRYINIADLCGRQLLHSQRQQTGILREGWWPERPPEGYSPDAQTRALWISNIKINVRVGYVVRALADLIHATDDSAYRDGLTLFLDGFEQYQNADGSFPADIRCDRIEVQDPTIKGHFMTYILNGFARASATLGTEPRLQRIAVRLAEFLIRRYRQSGCLPYGDMHDSSEGEKYVWRSANPDAIFGFAWLHCVTGDPVYREVACRIAIDTLLKTLHCPDVPDFHGGIPIWPNPNMKNLPEFDGYHQFWTLLGLQALQETTQKGKQ